MLLLFTYVCRFSLCMQWNDIIIFIINFYEKRQWLFWIRNEIENETRNDINIVCACVCVSLMDEKWYIYSIYLYENIKISVRCLASANPVTAPICTVSGPKSIVFCIGEIQTARGTECTLLVLYYNDRDYHFANFFFLLLFYSNLMRMGKRCAGARGQRRKCGKR